MLNVINPKLDGITPKIESLIQMVSEISLSHITATDDSLPQRLRNPDISDHTQQLTRSVKAVITTASTATGVKSTIRTGSEDNFAYFSEYGGPLDDTWKARTEQWIPPPDSREELCMYTDSSGDVGPNAQIAGTNSYTENGLIAEYESDDEFDFEIVQDLLQSGRQKHAERSYAEAAAFFKSSIARAQKLGHTRRLSLELEDVQAKISSSNAEIEFDIVQRLFQEAKEAYVLELYSEAADMFRNGITRTRRLSLDLRSRFELRDIQLKSAFSFLFLGELREAEWAFSDMVKQQIADDKGRVSNLHTSSGLAQIYLCRENFEEAERWCRQSIVGWKRLFGKEHPLYLTSPKMMELIHETNGDSATAVVFANLSCALNLQSAEQTKHSISPTLSASQTRNMVVSYHAKRAKALLSELRLDRNSNDEALHSLCSLQAGQGTRHISNITATVRFLLDQGADSNAKPGCKLQH